MLGLGLSYISLKALMRIETSVAKLHLEPRSDMFAAYTFKWPPSAHFFPGEGPVQWSKENHRMTPGRKQGSERCKLKDH